MLCYWIISKKGKVLSRTTVQHITDDEQGDSNVQERVHNHHGYLEAALGIEDFGTSLDGYGYFINDDEEGI